MLDRKALQGASEEIHPIGPEYGLIDLCAGQEKREHHEYEDEIALPADKGKGLATSIEFLQILMCFFESLIDRQRLFPTCLRLVVLAQL